jgi:putative nucleotidyltransferase with HDIG domain
MNKLVSGDIVRTLHDLPALPPVLIELIHSFDQPNINIGEVAQRVSRDQALSAKTLRLANSSFYGLQCKVRTIQQAITVLGFDSVRSMITSAGIIDSLVPAKHNGFDFKRFWQHSIATALCAKTLAGYANLNQELGFMCGLLHDIGTLVLVTKFPVQLAAAGAYRTQTDCHQIDAEQQVLGTDHAAVGSALAEHWKFPLLIQRAITRHHFPMRQDLGDLPSVVHVANAVVHALDLCMLDDELVPPLEEAAWDSLGIDPRRLHQLFHATESGFEEACRILSP